MTLATAGPQLAGPPLAGPAAASPERVTARREWPELGQRVADHRAPRLDQGAVDPAGERNGAG